MKIIIVGAADIFDLASIVHGPTGGQIVGYCGLAPIATSRYADFPFLGDDLKNAHSVHPEAAFLLALSNNIRRRELTAEVAQFGGRILSAIHPAATIFPTSRLGRGVVVQPGVIISTLGCVEDGVYLNYGALVGHDVRVGAFSFISPGARLLGEVQVGADVFVGSNAVIHPRVRIGDGAKIAAGAQVHRNVPRGATVMLEQKTRILGM